MNKSSNLFKVDNRPGVQFLVITLLIFLSQYSFAETLLVKEDLVISKIQKDSTNIFHSGFISIPSKEAKKDGGKRYLVNRSNKAKAIVLAWTGVGCPMSKVYLPRIQNLANKYHNKKVQFYLINSNSQDSAEEIEELARSLPPHLAIVRDVGGYLAKHLKATRTTDTILLDHFGKVLYRGAIDNQYGYRRDRTNKEENSSLSFRKSTPSQKYLSNAIQDVLAGRKVQVSQTDAMGCAIGLNWNLEKTVAQTEINFHEHIEPIFRKHCQSCHHKGGSGPFDLTSYRKAKGWADTIKEQVTERRMPPWNADPKVGHFKNARSLDQDTINSIVEWVDKGTPEGDPKKALPKKEWIKEWDIGKPSHAITLPKFKVPAEGRVPYRYVTIDPKFKEDKWITAAQIHSSNPELVHHILVFLKEPRRKQKRAGRPWTPSWRWEDLFSHLSQLEQLPHIARNLKYSDDLFNNGGGGLFGYFLALEPGEGPTIFSKGQALFLPAGAKLTFQVHYQPNGKSAESQSTLALKFSKTKPKHVRHIWSATSVTFDIPPGKANHKETIRYKFKRGGQLLSLKPHMHLRGKSARYFLKRKNGKKEMLLNVPNYDFDWQHTYEFTNPIRVERGEQLIFEAVFDNSKNNPNNPDPSERVFFGLQSDEEMMIGYFEIIWDQYGRVSKK